MEDATLEDDYGMPDVRPIATVGSPGRQSAGDSGERLIRWERFLPKRSLRVLLVEHDDSTRHIVAALLRKCSYHVLAVGDGRKAWEVMKEKSFNFDLVLTEFEMPLLSGIVLLTKIVGTETCKNIPVIIMSSQDSVGIVHKCMLKGAADFLVKPLRKNELRNLWQHVWRRHCSNNYACASENSAASNQISSNAGEQSQTGENSDKGSNAQSLGSKLDAELEICQKQAEVLAKLGRSSWLVESHPEQPGNNMTTIAGSSAIEDNGILKDKTLVAQDFAFLRVQMAPSIENNVPTHREDDLDSLRCAMHVNEKSNLSLPINSLAPIKTTITEEIVSSGASSKMKHALPLRELSLRTQLNVSVEHHVKKKNILNHSNTSAFTRYAGTCTKKMGQRTNSSFTCIRNEECVDQPQSHVTCHGTVNMNCSLSASRGENVLQHQIFSDGNMEEVGVLASRAQPQNVSGGTSCSEHISFQHAQLGFMPMPLPVGAAPYQSSYTGFEAQLQPINYLDSTLIAQSLAATDNGTSMLFSDHFSSLSGSVDLRCRDLCHPFPSRVQLHDTKTEGQRNLSCSHWEEFYGGSVSKSLLKASGNNGSHEITDAAAVTGAALESGTERGIQNCNKKLTNSYSSYRETALIKFRLKRKDRCFKKKVRYHNRQKLAEQRPRVKGQFVREKMMAQEADGRF